MGGIKGVFGRINNAVSSTQKALGGAARNTQKALGGAARNTQKALGGAARNTQRALGGAVRNTKRTMGGAVRNTQRALGGAVRNVRKTAGGTVRNLRNAAGGTVRNLRNAAGGALRNTRRTVGGAVRNVRTAAGGKLRNVRTAAGGTLRNLRNAAGGTLRNTRRAAGSTLRNVRNTAGGTLRNVRNAAGSTTSSLRRGASGALSNTRRTVGTTLRNTRRAAGTTLRNTRQAAGTTLRNTRRAAGTTLRNTHQAAGNTGRKVLNGYHNVVVNSYAEAKALKQSNSPLQRAVGTASVAIRDGVAGTNRTVDGAVDFWKGVKGPGGRVGEGLARLGQVATTPLRMVDHTATTQQRNRALVDTAVDVGLVLVTGGAGKLAKPVATALGRTPLGKAATQALGRFSQTRLGRNLTRTPKLGEWINNAPARAMSRTRLGGKLLNGEARVRNLARKVNNFGRPKVRISMQQAAIRTTAKGRTVQKALPGSPPNQRALPPGTRGGTLVRMEDAINPYKYIGRGEARYGFPGDPISITNRVNGIKNAIMDARMGLGYGTANVGRIPAQAWGETYKKSATLHINFPQNKDLPWDWTVDANLAYVDTVGTLAKKGELDLFYIQKPGMVKGTAEPGSITENELKQLWQEHGLAPDGGNGFIYLLR